RLLAGPATGAPPRATRIRHGPGGGRDRGDGGRGLVNGRDVRPHVRTTDTPDGGAARAAARGQRTGAGGEPAADQRVARRCRGRSAGRGRARGRVAGRPRLPVAGGVVGGRGGVGASSR